MVKEEKNYGISWMGEHLVVNMEQLPKEEKSELVGPSSSSLPAPEGEKVVVVVDEEDGDEEAPLIGMGECRICQEEDSINNLESPCACSGSLKVNTNAPLFIVLAGF